MAAAIDSHLVKNDHIAIVIKMVAPTRFGMCSMRRTDLAMFYVSVFL